MYRKLICAMVLLVCLPTVVSAATYKDVPQSHWGHATVDWVTSQGYMAAYDGYFSPNKPIARVDAIVALAAMKGIKEQPTTAVLQFEDFTAEHKGYSVIAQLVEQGIIKNQQFFNPQEPITRAQLVKVLALLFDLGVDAKNDTSFSDVPQGLWVKDYVESLGDIGIINNTQPRFYPFRAITKIQLAAFMERTAKFTQQLDNNEVIYDYLQKKYIYTFNYNEAWVKSVIDLVNEQRKIAKLQPLAIDPELSQIAIVKAIDMIDKGYFSHESPTYGHPWDMATLFNYQYVRFGENIARIFKNPKDVMHGWMNSPKHRDNILNVKYTHMGLGVQQDASGRLYWVQMFSSE